MYIRSWNATFLQINRTVRVHELSIKWRNFTCCQVESWCHIWTFNALESVSVTLWKPVLQYVTRTFRFSNVFWNSFFFMIAHVFPSMIDKRFHEFSIHFCYHSQGLYTSNMEFFWVESLLLLFLVKVISHCYPKPLVVLVLIRFLSLSVF